MQQNINQYTIIPQSNQQPHIIQQSSHISTTQPIFLPTTTPSDTLSTDLFCKSLIHQITIQKQILLSKLMQYSSQLLIMNKNLIQINYTNTNNQGRQQARILLLQQYRQIYDKQYKRLQQIIRQLSQKQRIKTHQLLKANEFMINSQLNKRLYQRTRQLQIIKGQNNELKQKNTKLQKQIKKIYFSINLANQRYYQVVQKENELKYIEDKNKDNYNIKSLNGKITLLYELVLKARQQVQKVSKQKKIMQIINMIQKYEFRRQRKFLGEKIQELKQYVNGLKQQINYLKNPQLAKQQQQQRICRQILGQSMIMSRIIQQISYSQRDTKSRSLKSKICQFSFIYKSSIQSQSNNNKNNNNNNNNRNNNQLNDLLNNNQQMKMKQQKSMNTINKDKINRISPRKRSEYYHNHKQYHQHTNKPKSSSL